MTGQEFIDTVKSHLGDRSSGMIGSLPVDTAVMYAVNAALLRVARKKNFSEMERRLSIDVTDSAYQYPFPTLDTDGTTTIRVKKNLMQLTCIRNGETIGYPVKKLTTWRRDQIFPITDASSHTGRPEFYSIWANMLEVWPYPDDSYTLYLRCYIWPRLYTTALLSLSSPYDEDMDYCFEAAATGNCFARLQQQEDAMYWYKEFTNAFHEIKIDRWNDSDWQIDSGMIPESISMNKALDPFVMRSR